jgi:hypothetical protein
MQSITDKFKVAKLSPKELRVGNLILSYNRIVVVRQVNDKEYNNIYTSENMVGATHGGNYDGIPLSISVVTSVNFIYSAEHESYLDKLHSISIKGNKFIFKPNCTEDSDLWVEIKYLHELQNVYYYNSKFKELIEDEKIKDFIGRDIKK